MRLVLIHGIAQEGKSAQRIHDDWMPSLRASFGRQDLDTLSRISRVDAAYYGDTLEALSSVKFRDQAVAMGADTASDDFDEFAVEALEGMALRIGVTREQIEAEAGTAAVPQGAGPHKRWLKAIARAIEVVSPLEGTLAMRVLGQAHAYLRNQHNHDEVNALVRPLLEDDEPMVIVSHSLGTVVAYALLREFVRNDRPRDCALLVTLGSPLGIRSVRKSFARPRVRPEGTRRWFNGADPEDFVALQVELTADNFGPGIENHPDFENGQQNPHSINGYLSDGRVARVIADAVE